MKESYKQEMLRLLNQSKAIRKYNEELKEELKALDREAEIMQNVRLVIKAERIANKVV